MNGTATNQPQQNMLFNRAQASEQAGHMAKAAHFYKLAASAAATVYDNDLARTCLNKALALTSDNNLTERFNLLLARERHLALLGQTHAQADDLAALELIANWLDEDAYRAQVAARQAAWREATGDLAGAVTVASMAARLAQLAHLPLAEALARAAWGRALTRQAHYRQAQTQLDQALALAQAHQDKALMALIEHHRGVLAYDRVQLDQAQSSYDHALALYRELGDRQGQIHIHGNLGHIHQAHGRLTQARQHWEESYTLFQELGDAEGSLRTLINLAAASSDVGQYEQARGYAEKALALAERSGIVIGQCFAQLNLGLITHYLGQHEASVAANRTAHQLASELGSQRLQAHALAVLGHALVGQEQFSAAEEAYWEAIALWQKLEIPNMVAEAQAGLARAARSQGQIAVAQTFVKQILAQAADDPNFEGAELPVRIYLTCYQVLHDQNDPRAAATLAQGRQLLDKLAAGLEDEAVRHSLCHDVPAHHDILTI